MRGSPREPLASWLWHVETERRQGRKGEGKAGEGGSVDMSDTDALRRKMKERRLMRSPKARKTPLASRKEREAGTLTMSGFSRAKMAKVDSLSHTHLVRNESTSTALQPLADQDPSREELHTHSHARTQAGRHARTQTGRRAHTHRKRKRDAVNEDSSSQRRKRAVQIRNDAWLLLHFTFPRLQRRRCRERRVRARSARLHERTAAPASTRTPLCHQQPYSH